MQYVNLGRSGLKVSKLILGCMSYGSTANWMIPDHDEGIRQMKHAYDRGINAFDTANVYSAGESEIILGKFLKQHSIPRESVVILTKTFQPDDRDRRQDLGPAGWTNRRGLSRKRIFASVESSLERLQLNYIDVLQCHRFDTECPIEETMQALHDIVQAGKVRYIGMSSCWAWQFQLMQSYAINNHLTPFISMQNHYSALYREEEREVMPMLKHYGVGSIPWGPMAGGLLCRPAKDRDATSRGKGQPANRGTAQSQVAIIDAVEQIAQKRKVPMAQIAIAWALQSKYVTAPIIGVRSTERLDELVNGLDTILTRKEIEEIEASYVPLRIDGHV